MESIVKMEGITKLYKDGPKEFKALDNVSLDVKAGEFVAIIGPSGSGKSTLLSIAGALLSPSSGKIAIDGIDLSKLSQKEITELRLEKIGFVFQAANLIPYLKIKDQLGLIGKLSSRKQGKTSKQQMALLEEFGLGERINHYPSELSGGQRQRVAIARALINDPKVIFADEPTASLDSKRGRAIVEMLSHEIKSRKKAGIMVTHDERVLDLCDRIVEIKDGRLVESKQMIAK